MIKAGIIGASGYTGVELARILTNHPELKLTFASSRQHAGKPLSEVFANLRDQVDVVCSNPSIDEMCDGADVLFAAVPHKTAMDLVPQLLERGKKVVDLSADFRIRNVAVYEKWYQPHSSPELLEDAVYGLPELYRYDIKSAKLVANPGCYPTSIILGLAPLLKAGAIDSTSIIADSKSGATGAGRGANTATLFCEVNDGFKPYKVGRTHRHTPEIEQELSCLAGTDVKVTFTPHLLPIGRGILSTVYATLKPGFDSTAITELYKSHYDEEKFVRLLPYGQVAATQYVRGSNYCDISFAVDTELNRLIVMTAIDNIVKGASGQAVQNMNLMCGLPETCGLEMVPYFP